MPRQPSPVRPATRCTALWVAVVLCVSLVSGPAAGVERHDPVSADTSEIDLAALGWVWPADSFRLARVYIAPAHEYGPGHRGIDLALIGSGAVLSPADGVVAFAGRVAGRGVLTIDHGGGLVTTLEPVETTLVPGTSVRRGDDVAILGLGGHAEAGAVHFGVRLDGRYINPMLLLGGVPRAILLPCCA
jgi:murein DD-endopeptidase MepM/ murein hydrolase activator NlpD